MSNLKKYMKYILMVIGGMILTWFLVFVGFNTGFSEIKLTEQLPDGITVMKAEASKDKARIYGSVANKQGENINGKFIKITFYDSMLEVVDTEYLEITDVEKNSNKAFKNNINKKDVKNYKIEIVDNK